MKFIVFLTLLVSLPSLGSAAATQCFALDIYSAATFDPINFVPSESFHNEVEGYILYENKVDSGAQLFDFNTGTIYERRPDGTCVKYQTNTLEINNRDPNLAAPSIRNILSYTIQSGETRLGLQYSVGNLVYKTLVNDQCYASYISFTFDNNLKWSYFNTNQKALTSAEKKKIQSVLQRFVADDCPAQRV
ncbi:hypothetical protein ElyMa_001666000 [Elysia marginata]|uniref:Lipocalin/cytosolic fatty-acid binding domain-containing protein n=1 Tax=Elysia marginata TaxID=1093978 RepID=A0AAV4JP93_9GAST|nr:hypothetical protein ElyMa_001666000 [Elysia marginata]